MFQKDHGQPSWMVDDDESYVMDVTIWLCEMVEVDVLTAW